MKYFRTLFFMSVVLFLFCGYNSNKVTNQFSNDISCQDTSTILKMAEDTLFLLYGDQIQNQKPFKVELVNDSIWVITGTQDKFIIGGVAHIEIRKNDCKILMITHGK